MHDDRATQLGQYQAPKPRTVLGPANEESTQHAILDGWIIFSNEIEPVVELRETRVPSDTA